jgi:hypothetical protein
MPRPGSRPRKPLLGLRRKPGRLALAAFRMPLRAYRHDAGWLLGRTFLEFTHTGRKTGRPYETVAMVLRYDADAREAVICAAWGPGTDWCATCAPGRQPGCGSGASRSSRSTGSSPMTRPSTSPPGSAASTRGGCA